MIEPPGLEYPEVRLRRGRRTRSLRRLVRETRLSPADLALPLFVCPGEGVEEPVASMPGVSRRSVDRLVAECSAASREGVAAVVLFGIPERKDAQGSASWNDEGIVQRALRALAEELPELVRIADVCLCEYTDHGHCGVLTGDSVDNDPTVALLARQAVSLAAAGADIVAPSDMMDGRVAAIRAALDQGGHDQTLILSYAAKHASSFYGPFREAADSTPAFGDRRSYQMDPANRREAMREIELDALEGADILMVKPALPCLDLIWEARQRWDHPLAAFQVSGEYAMIQAAASRGWIDGDRVLMESLTAIKRAGADLILTYAARDAVRLLQQGWEE